MTVTSFSLHDDLAESLDQLAKELHRSKSWVINEAVRELLARQSLDKKRWLETVEAMDSVKVGNVVEGDRVDAWLESWGTGHEYDEHNPTWYIENGHCAREFPPL